MEHDRETAQAELLAEEVTADELRELLHRLGQAEFGGSENATVGAIVEATGSTAPEVGRILGDIRREDFDRRFGLRLDAHEGRIERLEDATERIENAPAMSLLFSRSDHSSLSDEETEIMSELVEQRRRQKEMQPLAIAAAIAFGLVALIVLVAALASSSRNSTPTSEWQSPPVERPENWK